MEAIRILAFYFSLLVPWQPYPILVGPYDDWEQCNTVREFLDRRGYDTDDCITMPLPQEARYLRPLEFP